MWECLLLVGSCCLPPGESSVHAIEKTRVWSAGTVTEGVTILLRDGRIAAIGPDVPIPPHAERIDGRGLTLMPGFLDAASELGLVAADKLPTDLPNNLGLAQDSSANAYPETAQAHRKGLRPERRARELLVAADADASGKLRLAGFTTVVTTPNDGLLTGQSCAFDLSGLPPRDAVLCEPGWIYAKFRGGGGGGGGGERGGAGRDSAYPTTLMGVLAHLRQAFLDARRLHDWRDGAHRGLGLARPPDDTCLIALEQALDRKLKVVFQVDRESDIHRALDLAKEFNLAPVIVGAKEGWKCAARLAAERVPVIAGLALPDPPERKNATKKEQKKDDKKDEGKGDPPAGAASTPPATEPAAVAAAAPPPPAPAAPPDAAAPAAPPPAIEWEVKDPVLAEPLKLFDDRQRQWEEEVRNVQRLLEAGVTVAFTTRGSSAPSDFIADLRTAVEKGLPADAALKALTETPARLLGVEQEVGAVRVGMAANLILVEGELTAKERAVRHVFVGPKHFEGVKPKPKDEKKADGEGAGKPGEKGEAPAGGSPPLALDLTGTWSLQGSGGGGFKSTLTLTQKGSELTGQLESEMGVAQVSQGSLEGDQFKLVITAEFQNQKFEFTLKGKATKDELTGTFETPFGEPTEVTAKRSPGPDDARESDGCGCGAHPEDQR